MQSAAIFSEAHFLQDDDLISVAFSVVKYYFFEIVARFVYVIYIFTNRNKRNGKLKSRRIEIFYVELFNF